MHIRDVEIFRAIMNAGSATKAALLLKISQPAVSQGLRRLELGAGMPLFARVRGRLQPMPEARAFLLEIERCFIGLEALEHRLASLRQHSVAQLRVASYPALGLTMLPRIIARALHTQPDLHVSLQVVSSKEVRARVLSGECDFGLMADEISTLGMERSVLAEVSAMIALPTKHPLVRFKQVSVKQLLTQRIVSLNPEDASTQRLMSALGPIANEFRPVVDTPYGLSLCELVLRGAGVGLVNPLVGLSYVERGLVLRPFELEVPFRTLLVLPPSRPLSASARDFLAILRCVIAEDLQQLKRLK